MRQLAESRALLLFAMIAASSSTIAQSPIGISWPDGQVLPHFATPAEKLDAVDVSSLTQDEQLTFSAFVGQVNRQRPRVALLHYRSEEGRTTWLTSQTVNLKIERTFDDRTKWELIAKYAGEITGVVIYDVELNAHMRNLACTVAGLRRALPVTPQVQELLKQNDITLPVLVDLTPLKLATSIDVYEYLHKVYWPNCEKRFIVSARPIGRGGDYHHTRDLASACGAAMIWLDCRDARQRELFGKYLADMPAGNAVVLGWYTSERSGVTAATRFGIGTMPADHFMNATVFSGGEHKIQIPTVPDCPPLDRKFYATIFLSDGDNIQYTQHAMRRIWDRSSEVRGLMPLNWTIAPGLVDIAPGMINYYYTTATSNDCFVCGPSGMGYTMPVNTLKEPGAPLGSTLDNETRLNAYTQLTSRYLQRAGLRVVTVWDDLTPMQRISFEQNCPSLLGVTVQNFRDNPTVMSSVVNDRLRFERLNIPYAGSSRQLKQSVEAQYARWDGRSPRFIAYQVNIWSPLKPERLVQLMSELKQQYPQIEFLRADHYFELERVASAGRTEDG